MIRCIRFRPYQKNTLKGFADLELTRAAAHANDHDLENLEITEGSFIFLTAVDPESPS